MKPYGIDEYILKKDDEDDITIYKIKDIFENNINQKVYKLTKLHDVNMYLAYIEHYNYITKCIINNDVSNMINYISYLDYIETNETIIITHADENEIIKLANIKKSDYKSIEMFNDSHNIIKKFIENNCVLLNIEIDRLTKLNQIIIDKMENNRKSINDNIINQFKIVFDKIDENDAVSFNNLIRQVQHNNLVNLNNLNGQDVLYNSNKAKIIDIEQCINHIKKIYDNYHKELVENNLINYLKSLLK